MYGGTHMQVKLVSPSLKHTALGSQGEGEQGSGTAGGEGNDMGKEHS